MLTIALVLVAALAGIVAGALEGSKVEGWIASWKAGRLVTAAQKIVDAEVARVTALENARATIVAHKTAPAAGAGVTGPTGA
jgi:hypothetical protein